MICICGWCGDFVTSLAKSVGNNAGVNGISLRREAIQLIDLIAKYPCAVPSGGQGVAGSNPAVPTNKINSLDIVKL